MDKQIIRHVEHMEVLHLELGHKINHMRSMMAARNRNGRGPPLLLNSALARAIEDRRAEHSRARDDSRPPTLSPQTYGKRNSVVRKRMPKGGPNKSNATQTDKKRQPNVMPRTRKTSVKTSGTTNTTATQNRTRQKKKEVEEKENGKRDGKGTRGTIPSMKQTKKATKGKPNRADKKGGKGKAAAKVREMAGHSTTRGKNRKTQDVRPMSLKFCDFELTPPSSRASENNKRRKGVVMAMSNFQFDHIIANQPFVHLHRLDIQTVYEFRDECETTPIFKVDPDTAEQAEPGTGESENALFSIPKMIKTE